MTNHTALTSRTASSRPGRRGRAGLASLAGVVACTAIACGGDSTVGDVADTTAPPTTASADVPDEEPVATTTTAVADSGTAEDHSGMLPPGTHVGISWFAPPPAEATADFLALWDEANAQATVGRVLMDWIDVEPSEGDYDFTELEEQLETITDRGGLPMVTIAAVDVSGTPFPEWLGVFEPDRAAAAYARMVEAAAPIFEQYGVWLLAVANEPPIDDGLDIGEFTRFVEGVETAADEIVPDLPVTFVITNGDALRRDDDVRALVDVVDVFAVNHYCLRADLLTIGPEEIESHLDDTIELADDKPIVFQEFGCPASDVLGSDETFQAEWFERAFDAIRADEQVVAAYVFEFGNWSAELVALDYGEAFAAEPELEWAYERVGEWLQTSGLVRPDGTTRPAWDVYLANLGG